MPSHKACGTHEPRKSISCSSGRITAQTGVTLGLTPYQGLALTESRALFGRPLLFGLCWISARRVCWRSVFQEKVELLADHVRGVEGNRGFRFALEAQ